MGRRAAKQEEAASAILTAAAPREELAPWPQDLALSISPQPHLGSFLGQHEKLFGIYPGQSLGPEIADQVAQGARCRPARIDPSPKRHDHRRQGGRWLAIERYVVHYASAGSSPSRRPKADRRSALLNPPRIAPIDPRFVGTPGF